MPQVAGTQASLFVTCIIDQMYPQVGVSVVRVLRRLGVEVDFPLEQTCCGQPLYNSGFTHQAQKLARRVLTSFSGSQYVVVPSGSCSAMIKVFYQDLFHDDPATLQQVQQLAPRVYEFSQFLVDVLNVQEVEAGHSGSVTYHPSCHLLREMEVRDQPRKLLSLAGGLELKDLPQAEVCCGFGGTFAIKYPHISEEMLADKIDSVHASGAETLVSCDMGCLMHIEGGLSRRDSPVRVRHLAQIIDPEAG